MRKYPKELSKYASHLPDVLMPNSNFSDSILRAAALFEARSALLFFEKNKLGRLAPAI